jgi:glycosyltransferase involved in cell wall biosynthesis
MPKKVLIVTPHRPNRSPSQRFRFEQYLSFLEDNNYSFEWSYLVSEKDDTYFYQPGHYFKKLLFFLKCYLIRFKDLLRAHKYDLIFVQREAMFVGTSFFERQFAKRTKLIFDFDDSIFEQDTIGANKLLSWLKNPRKVDQITKAAHLVIVGNQYLANYAKKWNTNVYIIPTTIDLNHHNLEHQQSKKVTIGWTGSFSTLQYIEDFIPILSQIKQEYPDIHFKIIADSDNYYPEIDTTVTRWQKKTEITDLNTIDIGIMPLPDTKWTRGKCGFKGLQYMSLGIPCVMSPVGVNTDIIQNGINGFLANNEEEWLNILSNLIKNQTLRKKIGNTGRKTINDFYSTKANKKIYLNTFDSLF